MRNFFPGLNNEDLGKEVIMRGEKHILVGARPKAHAAMVLKNSRTNKYIAATTDEVKNALGR